MCSQNWTTEIAVEVKSFTYVVNYFFQEVMKIHTFLFWIFALVEEENFVVEAMLILVSTHTPVFVWNTWDDSGGNVNPKRR